MPELRRRSSANPPQPWRSPWDVVTVVLRRNSWHVVTFAVISLLFRCYFAVISLLFRCYFAVILRLQKPCNLW